MKELKEKKVIRPSNSPWCARALLVPKKDGSTRMTIDYTALNKHTIKDRFPLPNINTIFQVVKYDGGVAYYEIRFKHFGDDYCKWTAPEQTTNTTTEAYGSDDTAKKNYLGRWGMVRNNWYEINVNTINQLGKPVFGQMDITNDDTPDDNNDVEKWISFKINILSWAKRVQNEDL